MFRRQFIAGLTFGAAFVMIGAAITANAQNVTGAGLTFVAPIMKKWMVEYNKSNPSLRTDYQAVGSGAGIAQYKAGTVSFGASDVPMNDAESQGAPPTLTIPLVAGAVVLAYNVPGVGPGLKLTGDTIAGIYLKQITTWNDPRIKKDNPTINLPASPIFVVHRADGSGTTFIFTYYLCSVSPAWAEGPKKGKSVNWPVGVGGQGNQGVATLVRTQPGAIGYVELAYAISAKLAYGPVKNRSGVFVEPNIASTTAAIDAATPKIKSNIRASAVNQAGRNCYPIVGMPYALISKAPRDKTSAQALVAFMKWAMGPGQGMVEQMNYAPLPKSMLDSNLKGLNTVAVK